MENYVKWLVGQGRTEMLRTKVPRDSICAEIGVLRGDYSEAILDLVSPKKLFLIDNWTGPHCEQGQMVNMAAVHCQVLDRMQWHILSGQVVVMKCDSVEAASYFADRKFDWVYLDTSHLYEQTIAEITAWAPKIKQDGLLCGHDYNLKGVREAVAECEYQKVIELLETVALVPLEPPTFIAKVL